MPLSPLRWSPPDRAPCSTPRALRLSPRRDLKNNLISTVQPGAFLGLPQLKHL